MYLYCAIYSPSLFGSLLHQLFFMSLRSKSSTAKGKAPEVTVKPSNKTGKPAQKEKKVSKKRGPVAPEPDPSDEEGPEAAAEPETKADDDYLEGFSTDDDDSSDEELDKDAPAVDVQKLPTVAKDDATVQKKLEKAKKKPVRTIHCSNLLGSSHLLNLDGRPRCTISWTYTSWILRRPTEGLLLTIRRCNSTSIITY
jgi:hypothetical protein